MIRLRPLIEISQIQIIKNFFKDGGKCKWLRQDDGISFSKFKYSTIIN